ncbi:DUF551 domain-containing protein [Salmonella enterica]|uniref:DUF551 domain-containing protein n=1 Tax=Salmonella enterica TaxID=28901 RepID=UPI0009AE4D28|nr:DUF551 domain-containing protein [Salmonella enterica]ECT9264888.1 DUF551 domain-containing protein [Salmonella enterica subsp. enterica serovar Javiana]EDQ2476038.1 DUF551 domain-containing protein [Salmonella enterica subsp. enterica serovar Newport]EAO9292403.1 DUF551 domain-containing protein [Salmonella enterica]EAR4074744.1 DUF551 domain-containing protein [Salmonella enterica]EAS1798088.1 DUF551 domain-containing protein [Salmonella enterica]
MTITKERLLKIQHWRETYGADSNVMLPAEEAEELARIALASLEAKPIGAFHIADQQVSGTTDYIKDGEWPIDNGVIEVYAAPPAPVVPEKMNFSTACNFVQINGMAKEDRATLAMRAWNACRSAMLQGVEPVSQTYKLNELSGNSPVTPDGWISCSERMPDNDESKPIAIFTGKCLGQGMFVATYDDDGFFDYWEGMEIIGVTHWMPLPEPPQK